MGKDMADVDNPTGFQPYGPILRARWYVINTAPTVALYIGDAIENGGVYVSTPWGYMQDVIDAAGIATGDVNILGIALGFQDSAGDTIKYMPASTTGVGSVAGYVLVADHPDQLFVAQENNATNSIDLADAGQYVDIFYATGSSITGLSKSELASDTVTATVGTIHLKLHHPHEDDTPGQDGKWCRYIVSFADAVHYYRGIGNGVS